MSIVGGVFTETILKNIQIRADEIAFDEILKQDFTANVDVLKALMSTQTARIDPILNRNGKDNIVEVTWMNACDIEDNECYPCEIYGDEVSTNMQELELDLCREASFYVNDGVFRTNFHDAEEATAKGLVAADKAISEYLAVQAVNWLNTAKGVNAVTVGKGTVVANDTYILPAYWNASLMAYFARVAAGNKLTAPVLISGNQLYEQIWLAAMEKAQAGQEGNILKFGAFKTYFDLFNIDAVNTPDLITYMVNRGAFALANRTRFTPQVITYMDRKVWSMPSKFLPGVNLDVEYYNECDWAYYEQTTHGYPAGQVHSFKLTFNGGMFRNPVGCTEDRTGVLTFICGDGVGS